MAPDAPVVVAVEILRRNQVGDAVERLVVEEQRAEQRLLGLHRMRRKLERDELRIGGVRVALPAVHGHLVVTPPGAHHRNARRVFDLISRNARSANVAAPRRLKI